MSDSIVETLGAAEVALAYQRIRNSPSPIGNGLPVPIYDTYT